MDHNSWLLLRQASCMNTAGVEAFVAGHHELAIQQLNGALVVINKLLLIHCDRYDVASRFLETTSAAAPSGSSSSDELGVTPDSIEIPSLQDDRYYIYNQALLFAVPSTCDISFDGCSNADFPSIRKVYIQVSFFWSVVHFNMGLLLHKLIHETSENNQRYRDEVILFYKLCVQNLWVIPATSATMNLLMLCSVNNLSHAYLNLHDCCGAGVGTMEVQPQPMICRNPKQDEAAKAMALPFHQTELIQSLLSRTIGKVVSSPNNDVRSLTTEQHQQISEMSLNHIVISALAPSYVAPGA